MACGSLVCISEAGGWWRWHGDRSWYPSWYPSGKGLGDGLEFGLHLVSRRQSFIC